MDLSGSWEYIQTTARSRLARNKTPRHRHELGESAEVLGVAGELVARRFLGLSERVHEGFDHGIDIKWAGMRIDVKATLLTKNFAFRLLQWPIWKHVKSDIVLLTAVDPLTQVGVVVGYAFRREVEAAPINATRAYPCHEIRVQDLHHPWELYAMMLSGIGTPARPDAGESSIPPSTRR
jgi:hypothetical protein